MSDNVPFDYHHLCLALPHGCERQAPGLPVSIQLDRQINHLNNQPTHHPRSAIVATGFIERRLVFLVRPPSRSIDDRPASVCRPHKSGCPYLTSRPRPATHQASCRVLATRRPIGTLAGQTLRQPRSRAASHLRIQLQPSRLSGDLHDST